MTSEPPTERRTPAQQRGAAYQGAFEAVFAILIATGAGYWADRSFDTSPRFLIIGAVIGFGAFVLRLMRLRPDGPGPGSETSGSGASGSGRDDERD